MTLLFSILIHVVFFEFLNSKLSSASNVKVRDCEPIQIETCLDFGYRDTGLPNLVGHDNQADAEAQLKTFTPLVQYGCSEDLRFFLCSVYTPICAETVPDVIGPCRTVCERVRDDCEPILRQFGYPWPVAFNCSKFYERNTETSMCMEGGSGGKSGNASGTNSSRKGGKYGGGGSSGGGSKEGDDNGGGNASRGQGVSPPVEGRSTVVIGADPREELRAGEKGRRSTPTKGPVIIMTQPSGIGRVAGGGGAEDVRVHEAGFLTDVRCRRRTQFPDRYVFINRTGHCALRCGVDGRFGGEEKHLADVCTTIFGVVALLCTTLTIATFLVDVRRFGFADRLFFLMSVCFGMCAVAFCIRGGIGREALSCTNAPPVSGAALSSASSQHSRQDQKMQPDRPDLNQDQHLDHDYEDNIDAEPNTNRDVMSAPATVLAEGGLSSNGCTVVFALQYYFSMAGTLWWLVLSFICLVMGAGRMRLASIKRLSTAFHIAVWSVPAALTVVVLVRKEIEADELLGMCLLSLTPTNTPGLNGEGAVGRAASVSFLLIPLVVFFLLGITCQLGGCAGHCLRHRTPRRSEFKKNVSSDNSVSSRDVDATPWKNSEDLAERKTVRIISLLCFACALPLAGLIACLTFQVVDAAEQTYSRGAAPRGTTQGRDVVKETTDPASGSRSSIAVYLVQAFLSVSICVIIFLWVLCSAGTVGSWRVFFTSRCCRHFSKETPASSSEASAARHELPAAAAPLRQQQQTRLLSVRPPQPEPIHAQAKVGGREQQRQIRLHENQQRLMMLNRSKGVAKLDVKCGAEQLQILRTAMRQDSHVDESLDCCYDGSSTRGTALPPPPALRRHSEFSSEFV